LSIPKIIHQIWIGPLPPPEVWMATWREKHPGFKYILWDNKSLEDYPWDPIVKNFIDSYVSREQYHGAADVMRYQFLRDMGGFYAPGDSRCLKPIDDLLDLEAFACYESEKNKPGLISPIIGAPPQNPFLVYLVEHLKFTKPEDPAVRFVGNYFLTSKHQRAEHKLRILPSETFIPTWKIPPTDAQVEEFVKSGRVYATHEWGTTLGRFASGAKKHECSVVAVTFDFKNDHYSRMFKVFKKSLEHHMPEAEKIYVRTEAPTVISGSTEHKAANTHKLKIWSEKMWESNNTNFIFMDIDTFLRDDISDAFNLDFDIAYTGSSKDLFPFNLGVMFIRKNERTRKFLEKWAEVNNEMYRNRKFHKPYEDKYAGINQAAFGWMLENYEEKIKLRVLPPDIYNCSNNRQWRKHKRAKVIHVKHSLRQELFKLKKGPRLNTRKRRKQRWLEKRGMISYSPTKYFNDLLTEWHRWESAP
jgi:hypothetical protein